jgi:hypothetical protein
LLFYALAGLVHLLARLAGWRSTALRARLALFWSLLAASPLWLLHGALTGVFGPGSVTLIIGLVILAAFLTIWWNTLRAALLEPAKTNA